MRVETQKNTPEHLKALMIKAHENADETFCVAWDRLCCDAENIQDQWHGDDMLSAANTLISHVICLWLNQMYRVANMDDTGYSPQYLLENIFNGVVHMMPTLKKIEVKTKTEKTEFKRI